MTAMRNKVKINLRNDKRNINRVKKLVKGYFFLSLRYSDQTVVAGEREKRSKGVVRIHLDVTSTARPLGERDHGVMEGHLLHNEPRLYRTHGLASF